MTKIIIITILLACLLILPMVSADVIMPGVKSTSYCIKLANAYQFQDYVFISYVPGVMPSAPGYQILKQDDCISFGYKFNYANLYYIKKDKFNESDININYWFKLTEQQRNEANLTFVSSNNYREIYNESVFFGPNPFPEGSGLHSGLERSKIFEANRLYFKYNPDIFKLSDENFTADSGNMFWNPVSGETVNLKIVQNSDSSLSIEKSISKSYSPIIVGIYSIPLVALILIIYFIRKARR